MRPNGDDVTEESVQPTKKVKFWPGNPVSYTTTTIRLFFNDQPVGVGSGFVVKYARRYALVTNWHVLSGRSPITEQCLSPTGGLPNRADFHVSLCYPSEYEGVPSEIIHFKEVSLSLYEDDEMRVPVWRDERSEFPEADYAIILLESVLQELANPAYSLRSIPAGVVTLRRGVEPARQLRPEDINHFYPPVGHQVFIVGYPAGITPSGIFPIWKGGTIASEPYSPVTLASYKTDDVIMVDGLTRSGMSGAPVVCLTKPGDTFYTDDGVIIETDKHEPLLVGVYAGREGVTSREADLALGRVWKVGALERLLHREVGRSVPSAAV